MKKYRCIRDCIIKIGGRRRWIEGMTVEVEDDFEMSDNFELAGVEKYAAPEPVDEVNTLSGIQQKQKELSKPKTGFANNLDSVDKEQPKSKR